MISKIKTIAFAGFFAIISALTANAQNATMWKLDNAHTSVNFSVNHFFSAVTGKFTIFGGVFYFDPENLKGSKAEFIISVRSIDTENKKRDRHLRSDDFFDAKKYPDIKFKSTGIERKSENEFLVNGKLTIKDVTKDIVLPLRITGEMEHPMMEGTIILGLSTHVKIKRTDFGVGTGSWASTMVVGDEVDVNIHMELNREK